VHAIITNPTYLGNGSHASRRGSTNPAPQQAELSLQAPDEATHALTAADLAAVPGDLDAVITEGDPSNAKLLLRLLIDALGRQRPVRDSALLPADHARGLRDIRRLEAAGIEPVTRSNHQSCRTSIRR
jgi:hypothetical protein